MRLLKRKQIQLQFILSFSFIRKAAFLQIKFKAPWPSIIVCDELNASEFHKLL